VLSGAFAATPFRLAGTLVTALCFVALSAVTVVIAGRLDHRLKWILGPAAAVAALALEPVRSTFGFGQVNLALMASGSTFPATPTSDWEPGCSRCSPSGRAPAAVAPCGRSGTRRRR
jgi:hypothetical protein